MDARELLALSECKLENIEYLEDNPRKYLLLTNLIEYLVLEEDIRNTGSGITDVPQSPRKRKRTTKELRKNKRRREAPNRNNNESSSADDLLEDILDDLQHLNIK